MSKAIKINIEKDYHLIPTIEMDSPTGYVNYYVDYFVSSKDVLWSTEEENFIIYSKDESPRE